MAHISYLALGSNLKNPKQQVNKAITAISQLSNSELLQQSSLYETAPLLPPERPNEIQENYINCVVKIATKQTAEVLLNNTHRIEQQMGRVRSNLRWQARIIDIDILLFDDVTLQTTTLTIPHPEMHKRLFVIEPLFEIAPDLILPGNVAIQDLYTRLVQSN